MHISSTWRNDHNHCFLTRVCQRDNENPWCCLCIKASKCNIWYIVLWIHRYCFCTLWKLLESDTKDVHDRAFHPKACKLFPTNKRRRALLSHHQNYWLFTQRIIIITHQCFSNGAFINIFHHLNSCFWQELQRPRRVHITSERRSWDCRERFVLFC